MSFSTVFLGEVRQIASAMDAEAIEAMAKILAETRAAGRLFILGVGGSAANASHAVNDFRKIAGIEAYAPTDSVAELTARTNDEGWPTVFEAWLKGSRLKAADTVLILSVGGGDAEKGVSPNIVKAVQYAKSVGSRVIGIVGRDGGYTGREADKCVFVPVVNPDHVTPHSEAWQAVVWHLLVSHPLLKQTQTKWESVAVCRAVFLDRDGTLTTSPQPPVSADELNIAPGALESLASLKEAGFKLVVVTNQPDIGRGKLSRESVDAVNEALTAKLPLDKIYTCPHSDEHGCDCRKPLPGMLRLAATDLGIDLEQSYMVGDTWRDMEASAAAGCTAIWLRNTQTLNDNSDEPSAVVVSLAAAAAWILEDSKLS
jgi:D-sedoheptulose 7-phosphate isomerase